MRQLIVLFFFSHCFINCFSQQPEKAATNYSLSGTVYDSLLKHPLEYATITLSEAGTKKLVNGTITNSKGLFKLANIHTGTYLLVIESLGYGSFSRKIITADTKSFDINIQAVYLTKKTATLQNVTVTSTRQTIENRLDKIVFNVDKDITSQGGMATDALKKIPQVTVDINGNVELLGNPSIRFLINGKPSGIFGNSPADALQSIPASQIQSIEVITSPTAKYDASGTGGIINIILKKSKMEGFNGNINIAAGSRLENASINASLKKNNFGLNAYFSGNKQLVSSTPVTMDRVSGSAGGTSTKFLQQSMVDFDRNGFKSGIGLDWDLSKKDNISASLGYNHFANRNNGVYDQTSIQYDAGGSQIGNSNSIRLADTKVNVNTFDNEISYKRKFQKDKQELELFYSGSYSQNNTNYIQSQHYKTSDSAFAGSSSLNPGKENGTEVGVNYAQPFGKDLLLETGVKLGIESIISSADVFTLNTASGIYVKDAQQTFQSDFRRKVYAAYVSMSFPLFKILEAKAGLRYEQTENEASYSNSGKANIPAYKNWAPSFIVAHNFNNKQTLKFAFSYRLERPDFRDLNPFMNLSDPHNITTGNPNLQPEIGHIYELTYIKSFEKGTTINAVLYLQKNSPDIKPYISYYPVFKIGDSLYNDVTVTTRATIAAEIRSGINLSITVPVDKKLSLRSNILAFNRHLNNINDTPSVINGFGVRMNVNATYQFSKSLAAEIFGNYNSGMKWQGVQPAAFSYTMAVRKLFKNTKGSLGFIAVNPFNKYIDQRSLQEAKGIVTHSLRQLPYRSFGISFLYKFGHLKFTKAKENDNYMYTPPSDN